MHGYPCLARFGREAIEPFINSRLVRVQVLPKPEVIMKCKDLTSAVPLRGKVTLGRAQELPLFFLSVADRRWRSEHTHVTPPLLDMYCNKNTGAVEIAGC